MPGIGDEDEEFDIRPPELNDGPTGESLLKQMKDKMYPDEE